jgi:hypothetical protein
MDVVGSEGSNEPRPNPLYILHTHQVYWPHHPIDNLLVCPRELSDLVRYSPGPVAPLSRDYNALWSCAPIKSVNSDWDAP